MARIGSMDSIARGVVRGVAPLLDRDTPGGEAHRMPTVRLPAAFLNYACERSLVCCQEPVRAPCSPEEEARIARRLASTEAGRAHLPILHAGFQDSGGTRVFAQHAGHGRCVHLLADAGAEREPGCALHLLGGLDALSAACRNYPRAIAGLPLEDGAGVALEVLFLLACPTAAGMLVRDPSPFRFVEVPLEGWLYPAHAEVGREVLEEVRELRRAWWAALAEDRGDPRRLAGVLGALLDAPYEPTRAGRVASGEHVAPSLLGGARSIDVGVMLEALERVPERGPTYGAVRWEVRRRAMEETSGAALLDALDIAPELLTAFLDHQIPWARVHDLRPFHAWLRTMTRRVVLTARLADTLLDKTPFAIDTLFADLFMASIHLDVHTLPPSP